MPPSSTTKSFGRRLKAVREERGLSQSKLGKRCQLTVSELSRYENGSVTPSIDKLVRIAQALKVSADTLLFADGPPALEQPRNLKLWSVFVELERMANADQETVVQVIEAMAAKRQMKEMLVQYGQAIQRRRGERDVR